MPELPEVETVRRGLEPTFVGAAIRKLERRRADLRFPFPPDFDSRVEGRTILALGRRAKYLLADLDSGDVLVMHLGMSGSFRIEAPSGASAPGVFHHDRSKDTAHDHVTFHLSNGARIVYNDPRRFGFMDIVARRDLPAHPFFRALGIEPLGNELDGVLLSSLFKDKKTPLKAALLDQRLIAGLGNIYVCEALHRAGLSPNESQGRSSEREPADRREPRCSRIPSAPFWRKPSLRAAHPCAITVRPMERWATSSIRSACMTAKESHAQGRAATGSSSASFNLGARPFIAAPASADQPQRSTDRARSAEPLLPAGMTSVL